MRTNRNVRDLLPCARKVRVLTSLNSESVSECGSSVALAVAAMRRRKERAVNLLLEDVATGERFVDKSTHGFRLGTTVGPAPEPGSVLEMEVSPLGPEGTCIEEERFTGVVVTYRPVA